MLRTDLVPTKVEFSSKEQSLSVFYSDGSIKKVNRVRIDTADVPIYSLESLRTTPPDANFRVNGIDDYVFANKPFKKPWSVLSRNTSNTITTVRTGNKGRRRPPHLVSNSSIVELRPWLKYTSKDECTEECLRGDRKGMNGHYASQSSFAAAPLT